MQTEVFTWADFDSAIKVLAKKVISSDLVLTSIYGIPRGGLVVAVALSHSLGLPVLVNRERVTILTLVVDDISDTGKTLLPFASKGNTIATLHMVPTTFVQPTFFVRIRKAGWVAYAWEDKKEDLNG